MLVKLDGKIRSWDEKTSALEENDFIYDPAQWGKMVKNWDQAKFEFFVPIVMGREPGQTLDRFRDMSEDLRVVLLNEEADLARKKYMSACGGRDQAKGDLDIANKQIKELQSRKSTGDSKIAQLTTARDQVITERDQTTTERDQAVRERDQVIRERDEAIRGRDEADKERCQIRDQTRDRIEVVRKEKDNEKDQIEERHGDKVKELESKIRDLTVGGQEGDEKIRKYQTKIQEYENTTRGLEKKIQDHEKTIRGLEGKIRDSNEKARKSEENAQELERKTRELEAKTRELKEKAEGLQNTAEDREKVIRDFQTKAQELEQSTGNLKNEVSRRVSNELGMARFFMNQSGMEQELARDVNSWIPFVAAIDGSDELEQQEDYERLRPWTILQTWDAHDVMLADRPNRDLGGHIIHLYGRVLGRMWDEDTIDLIRVVVLHLKTVPTAPTNVLLHLLDRCLENLDESIGKRDPVNIDAHLVAFSFWQCANLIQKRLPATDRISQIAGLYKTVVAEGWKGISGLLSILGDDSGVEMKALIRSRRVLAEEEQPPSNTPVSSSLVDKPLQYCADQDIGLLVLPDIGHRVWALNLKENTIRLIDNSRGKYGILSEFSLTGLNGEAIIVPNATERDYKWVIDHLNYEAS
ncbi:putative structural maintenance of chromosomes protein [Eutypa lata UCREL1]|uniref:Putative structural maintenance of chromosomes protein n=1 Tax=Eutypa lata (strain UCR-EL1) TaxID=1287681 RepID=M7SPB0_EUTLA|nr:putative structural maintenance of chromosomes protein [Eutypa lata UCREL1]